MALKEGRCVNCGSILFLEPKNEKGHCLFCDAVFDNSEAFRAHAAPDDFTFPNDPQPKYDGPNLDPRPVAVTAPVPPRAPAAQKKAVPVFEPKVTAIPDAKIPQKAKIIAIGALLAVLAIAAAILVPLIMKRDAERQVIKDTLVPQLAGVDWDKNVSLMNMSNNQILIASETHVSQDDAEALFDLFVKARSNAMGVSEDTPVNDVSMKFVTPDGGYLIERNAADTSVVPLN